ncbi:MAG: GTP-binding protein [Deltaproteobacteria bacterium]|nr:MAG: GTP-binding protein [Deltaproteobacteria bacterium]
MLDPKTIRNVAIIAHDGAGKTALTEALLRHDAPARASKDGSTSHLDVDPEESKRNFTVATHITYAEHEGTLLNLLDAPGFSDFLTDADRSMAVCEGGLLLVSAVSGVKHQTEAHWDMAAERALPLLACVNKLDKDRASFLRALDDMEKTLNAKPIARTCIPGRPTGSSAGTRWRTYPSSSSTRRNGCGPGWWRRWRRRTMRCWRRTSTGVNPGRKC